VSSEEKSRELVSTKYRVSQNYVNTQSVETIYSQIIHDMCKVIYRTVSTCSSSCSNI